MLYIEMSTMQQKREACLKRCTGEAAEHTIHKIHGGGGIMLRGCLSSVVECQLLCT